MPSLHGYILYDKVIRNFAGNFGMASYDKLTLKHPESPFWAVYYVLAVFGPYAVSYSCLGSNVYSWPVEALHNGMWHQGVRCQMGFIIRFVYKQGYTVEMDVFRNFLVFLRVHVEEAVEGKRAKDRGGLVSPPSPDPYLAGDRSERHRCVCLLFSVVTFVPGVGRGAYQHCAQSFYIVHPNRNAK
jgi:hypothetical protein